jgi:hypothetical protein
MPAALERGGVIERHVDPVYLQSAHAYTEPAPIDAGSINASWDESPAAQFDLRSIGRNHEGHALRVAK